MSRIVILMFAACGMVLTGCTGSGAARQAEIARDSGTVAEYLDERVVEISFVDGGRLRGRSVVIDDDEISWKDPRSGRPRSKPLHLVEEVAVTTRGLATASGFLFGVVGGGLGAGVYLQKVEGDAETLAGAFGQLAAASLIALAGVLVGTSVGLARESQGHRVVLYRRAAPIDEPLR